MRKLLLLFTMLLFGGVIVNGQNRIISGKVMNESGSPLPDVSILVKGQKIGTTTNSEGSYKLSIPSSAKTLVFSSIGHLAEEVQIQNQSILNVTLMHKDNSLDEIVMVAYGAQKKSAFTGSASTIKADVLENRPVSSFEKALQGQATGITVQSASGQPGAASTVRIRGVGSFSASNTPLYVLDGVAVTTGDFTQAAQTADVLSTLDPRDIESITVLKDATAAGLYGSRAGNGVIVITTKRGQAGKSSINFSANHGYSSIAVDRHQLMNGRQYFKYWWDYFYDGRIAAGDNATVAADKANTLTISNLLANPFSTAQPFGSNGELNSGVSQLYDTDWRSAVLNQGKTEDYSISVSGGSDKTKFYLSGGLFDQKGIVLASDFKRYSTKFNLENNATNFLKVGVNTTLSYTEQNTPAGSGGAANPIRFSEIVSNVYPLYRLDAQGSPIPDPAGGYFYNYNTIVVKDYNPVGLSKKNIYNAKTLRGIVSPFLELSFTKDLKFRTMGTADLIDILETQYYNPVNGDGAGVKGRTYKYRPRDLTLTLTNTLSYGNKFGRHNVNLLAGQEAVKFRYENIYANGTTFPFDGIVELASAATPVTTFSSISEKRIYSLFSRFNYDFDSRYYLTGSLRRDGSSIFGEDSRFGTFWTVGGGWRIGKESFLNNADWIDELKLKGSYGISGNDNIGRYARLGLYSTGNNYSGLPGITYSQLENKKLHWEENDVLDIGLEASFLNRFRAEVTYFSRWSKDILFAQPLSYLTGFQTITTNLATMKNTGIEAMVEATIVKNKSFNWVFSANVTTSTNVIQKMNVDSLLNGSQRWKVGKDRYQWYLREWAGVDPTNGKPSWYMNEVVSGTPTGKRITTNNWNLATRYENGSALPKYYGGINNNFSYKEFDLSILTFYTIGGKIYDADLAQQMHDGKNPGSQLTTQAFDAWKKPGDVTNVPRFVSKNTDLGNNTSTRFLFDGSYLRLKSITIGYTLSRDLVSKIHLANARFYISGENLATWAKHKGMDPEVSIAGTADNEIPIVKTISMGLKIGF
ncbi:MAG: TonB-dependent receptor [Ginsengibacter sp.]